MHVIRNIKKYGKNKLQGFFISFQGLTFETILCINRRNYIGKRKVALVSIILYGKNIKIRLSCSGKRKQVNKMKCNNIKECNMKSNEMRNFY